MDSEAGDFSLRVKRNRNTVFRVNYKGTARMIIQLSVSIEGSGGQR